MRRQIIASVVAVAALAAAAPRTQTQAAQATGPFADSRVTHVGVIVRDVEQAAVSYGELFGVIAPKPAEFKGIAYPASFTGDREAHPKYAMLPLTGASMELLQPIGGPSPWRAHLDKYGESLHHICFAVKDVPQAVAHLKALGGTVEFGGDPGVPYAYVNFRDDLGFTIELSQMRPPPPQAGTAPAAAATAPATSLGTAPIRHIGMIVPRVEKTAQLFAAILGVPAPGIRPRTSKIVYPPSFAGDRDAFPNNITFSMNVNIEFAEPAGGKSMWRDQVAASSGASMHHLGVAVPVMQDYIASLGKQGASHLAGGPGAGYTFMDLRPRYGLAIELNGK